MSRGIIWGMDVRLRPWNEHDLALSQRLNQADLTEQLGGPETDDRVLSRHARYVADPGRMFVAEVDGIPAGSIGVWESAHAPSQILAEQILETGWKVLPELQGRGIATEMARQIVEVARGLGTHRWLHAFPGRGNEASNATCRSAGFTLIGPVAIEFPVGHLMRSNDWRIDLWNLASNGDT